MRPQLAQPALIPGLEDCDWGMFCEVLGAPCQGCGQWHRGLLLADGVGCCEHCGHAYAMTKPQPKPKPEPEKRRPPVQRAAVIQRRPISTPRPREGGARVVGSGRDGNGERDDGSGSGDGDGNGGGGEPPSRSRRDDPGGAT
jgi:hypothetical protein